ncbi:hypothetical protein GTQ99_00245 [Kineococcus sp. T13]|uniref:major capsid protein n=1 Tax=Kineococcus vitellinus TaxID=2696565 RepID=UPI0014126915|nr:major capsid protein [Kineococcus vitellinus]NAZ73860.1 hypothetical protein [Kineococcus vitellinus]
MGTPTVNNGAITVDTYSNQPTRVTALVRDLTASLFFIDDVFTRAGAVSGGAVVYDEVDGNDLYTDRDAEAVAPGEEFPILTSSRGEPKVAVPKKWGGKFFVTDEARERNDVQLITRHARKVSNTIVRATNAYTVAILNAAVVAHSRQVPGNDWTTAIPNGSNPTGPRDTPIADLALARKQAITDETGITYDTLFINENEELSLLAFFQYEAAKLRDALSLVGFTNGYRVSPRVPQGKPYLVASGEVGEYRVEKALSTESWREPETQETWFQTDTRPVAYVTNPNAVLQLTGVDGL